MESRIMFANLCKYVGISSKVCKDKNDEKCRHKVNTLNLDYKGSPILDKRETNY